MDCLLWTVNIHDADALEEELQNTWVDLYHMINHMDKNSPMSPP
jgi:hypothetical protein